MDSRDKDKINYNKHVDISNLKNWATQNLLPTSNLWAILLLEKDILKVDDFLSKIDTWLKLYRIETQRKSENN